MSRPRLYKTWRIGPRDNGVALEIFDPESEETFVLPFDSPQDLEVFGNELYRRGLLYSTEDMLLQRDPWKPEDKDKDGLRCPDINSEGFIVTAEQQPRQDGAAPRGILNIHISPKQDGDEEVPLWPEADNGGDN